MIFAIKKRESVLSVAKASIANMIAYATNAVGQPILDQLPWQQGPLISQTTAK
jgi:hypothetical protein